MMDGQGFEEFVNVRAGFTGATGHTGYTGPTGFTGATGVTGDTGAFLAQSRFHRRLPMTNHTI